MLRPATPLSLLLLAAFVLLLLSVLSVPVTKIVPLGRFKDVTFGVFGYCKGNGECSSIGVGYDTGMPLPSFLLPARERQVLRRATDNALQENCSPMTVMRLIYRQMFAIPSPRFSSFIPSPLSSPSSCSSWPWCPTFTRRRIRRDISSCFSSSSS